MDATTGFFARALFTARQIWSDAITAPPGLSMRSTMARMRLSSARRSIASATVRPPLMWMSMNGTSTFSPSTMVPSTTTTPICPVGPKRGSRAGGCGCAKRARP
jgi:hypothetical protein